MANTGTITWLLVNHRPVPVKSEQEALDESAGVLSVGAEKAESRDGGFVMRLIQ